MSNYPPGMTQADHDREFDQPTDEPRWFIFTKTMHVACKAATAEEAAELISDRFDSPTLEIDFDPAVFEEN